MRLLVQSATKTASSPLINRHAGDSVGAIKKGAKSPRRSTELWHLITIPDWLGSKGFWDDSKAIFSKPSANYKSFFDIFQKTPR
jgi:hypothetical protein